MPSPRAMRAVHWYAPDPRCVVYVPDAKHRLPRRLMRPVRKEKFETRCDTAFDRVIRECAASGPGREETWLSDDMIDAYCRLHREGHAHNKDAKSRYCGEVEYFRMSCVLRHISPRTISHNGLNRTGSCPGSAGTGKPTFRGRGLSGRPATAVRQIEISLR